MKRIIGYLFLMVSLFISINANAQADSPVNWVIEVSDKPNKEGLYELIFKASIGDKWHMYSQNLPSPDEGPLPTIFTFKAKTEVNFVGNVIEVTKAESVFDDVFEVQVNYFENNAEFKQLIKLTAKKAVVNGVISYMVCNESTCLPPNDIPFSVTIKP